MNIDIKEFLTPVHKKLIQSKITEAILKLNVDKIAENINGAFNEEINYSMLLADSGFTEELSKFLVEKIKLITNQ